MYPIYATQTNKKTYKKKKKKLNVGEHNMDGILYVTTNNTEMVSRLAHTLYPFSPLSA
jgi:hypothetical protein